MTYNPLADYDSPAWLEDALCAQTDPAIFHPEQGGSTQAAKRVCRRCPAVAACLQHALDHHEDDGIWGATSPMERRRMRQERSAA